MAKSRQRSTVTDQLKQTIADSGLSVYKLAKESGVPQPVLHRFMAGEQDLKLATVDKLAGYLGLRLRK
jgi:predicted transcriptional regulator